VHADRRLPERNQVIEHVIGIDPGLDGAGLAWLKRAGDLVTVRDVVTVRTKPGDPMATRLHTLADGIRSQLDTWASLCEPTPLTVALEVPTHMGRSVKAKRAGGENVFAADMSKFWQALGVTRAAIVAAGLPLVELPPGGAKKEYRQQLYIRWTHAGRNADERDAIVTACTHLISTSPVSVIAHLGAR
jgi:Holliday junction resolvasome RuvABC endonuclease subunit